MLQLSSRALQRVDVALCRLDQRRADVTVHIPIRPTKTSTSTNGHIGGDTAGTRRPSDLARLLKVMHKMASGQPPPPPRALADKAARRDRGRQICSAAEQLFLFSLTSTHILLQTHRLPVFLHLYYRGDTHTHTQTQCGNDEKCWTLDELGLDWDWRYRHCPVSQSESDRENM